MPGREYFPVLNIKYTLTGKYNLFDAIVCLWEYLEILVSNKAIEHGLRFNFKSFSVTIQRDNVLVHELHQKFGQEMGLSN